MEVSGDAAKAYRVVRLDSFLDAVPLKGELVSADDQTGVVVFKDAAGEQKQITLGQSAIRIMPR